MNTEEIELLNSIQKNENISQRELSSQTGLSLGAVNVLLYRMVNKGLIKIERLSPRSLRYIMTPHGLREKADATYNYIKNTYKKILEVQSSLDNVLHKINISQESNIVLIGNEDEIRLLIEDRLKKLKCSYKCIGISEIISGEQEKVILCWNSHISEVLANEGLEHFNIMERI